MVCNVSKLLVTVPRVATNILTKNLSLAHLSFQRQDEARIVLLLLLRVKVLLRGQENSRDSV